MSIGDASEKSLLLTPFLSLSSLKERISVNIVLKMLGTVVGIGAATSNGLI